METRSTVWHWNIIFFVLFGITLLFIPFFGLSLTIDPVLMPRFLVWSIMAFVLSTSFVIRLYKKPNSIDFSVLRRIIFPAFLGYFLFSLISLIKAVNITEAIYELLKLFLSMEYLFIATIILSKKRNYISILIKIVTVTATILSVIAIYQYFLYAFQKSGVDVLYSISATMAHKNQLSSALFLMLSFCLYGVLAFHGYWKFISIIPMILILLNIFLLQTRSVWVGLFVSTVAAIVSVGFLFRKFNICKETKTLFLRGFSHIIIIPLAVILIFGFFYLKSPSMGNSIKPVDTVTERILIWGKSLEAIQNNLLFGVGAGNWKITVLSYGLDKMPGRVLENVHFQRPHNDYIWVLSEIGIFGFTFYLSVFGIIIVYIFRIIIQDSNRNDKLLSISIFSGIVGYMIISFFSFPKERIFHSMFLLLMMAIVISIYHQSVGNKKNVSRSFIFALAAPSLFLILAAIVIGHLRLNAEIHTKRALAARRAQNWPMVISEIDKGYSAFATLDPMSTPLQWYRGEANFLLNNVSQALEDYKKAYKAHPYHIHVLNNLATCYELEGNHNKAVYYYKKALEIFPQFEDALINLGATYYNSGRYEEAYKTLVCCNPKTQNPKLEQYLKAVKKKLDKEEKSR